MGMYTELIFGASLENLPDHVVEALDYTINYKENVSQEALDFEVEYSLNNIFNCTSYYFGAHWTKNAFVYDDIGKHWVLSTRANCKNYQSQIEKFIEFITPYVESGSGPNDIFAYVQYEESDFPTIYSKEGKFDWLDKDKVSSAERDYTVLHNSVCDLCLELIPDYKVTNEVLKENNLDYNTVTYSKIIDLCLKEVLRRWNQSYDTNYKEMQKALETAKSALFEVSCDVEYMQHKLNQYKEKFGEL